VEKPVSKEIPFDFEVPLRFFEKSGQDEQKSKRIAGIISTESPDRVDEVVLQRGLDFRDFIQNGWFNDNHSKETDGILGYPESVQAYSRGEILPDGTVAPSNLTWSEGFMLPTKRAQRIWELGKALQGTGRCLGFSVEGGIHKRIGKNKKIIAKATVRNVAITNCPVNTESRLDILSKSLMAVENSEDSLLKALTMGPGPLSQPAGPRTGEGAGQILATESLETGQKVLEFKDEDDEKDKKKKSRRKLKKALTDDQAIRWVLARRPGMSLVDAERIIDITKALKRNGRL